jgi:hypothetical protein
LVNGDNRALVALDATSLGKVIRVLAMARANRIGDAFSGQACHFSARIPTRARRIGIPESIRRVAAITGPDEGGKDRD